MRVAGKFLGIFLRLYSMYQSVVSVQFNNEIVARHFIQIKNV